MKAPPLQLTPRADAQSSATHVHRCSGPDRHAWATAEDAARCCNGYHRVSVLTQRADGTYRLVSTWEPIDPTDWKRTESDAPSPPPETPIGQPGSLRLVSESTPVLPPQPVRHAAFIRAIEREADESVDYQQLTSGLAVLRLLDRVHAKPAMANDVATREIQAVKRAVDALASEALRQTLGELVSAIHNFAKGASDRRISTIVSYAQFLERTACWEPAADTYLTAIELIRDRPDDLNLLPLCYSRAGIAFRHIGRLDQAAELFDQGIVVASSLGDTTWALRLRISLARIESHKGNLAAATEQLERIVDDAEQAQLPAVAAAARHDLGHVAFLKGQFQLAATYFFRAMKTYTDPYDKQRAMHDLGAVLTDLGYVTVARTVCSVLYDLTAETSETRVMAGLNLLRIAILTNDAPTFQRLRQELAQERMSGRLRTHYHLLSGQGFETMGDVSSARAEFEKAIVVAQAHRAHQLVIEADEILKSASPDRLPIPATDVSDEFALVLSEIEDRRGEFAVTAE
jgi:tetratricopeptide (TPR) repeat protein